MFYTFSSKSRRFQKSSKKIFWSKIYRKSIIFGLNWQSYTLIERSHFDSIMVFRGNDSQMTYESYVGVILSVMHVLDLGNPLYGCKSKH